MKIHYIVTLAAAIGAITASASPLTPDQALAAVNANQSASTRMKAPARALRLAYTVTDKAKATPTVYVFANPDADGFIVTAADDATSPLMLGYSDAPFDPANMPPAMRYWLDCYSAQVSYDVAHPLRPASAPATLVDITDDVRAIPGGTLRKASKSAISPLCATRWNQDAPYYNNCPTYGGERCVTGCVATAMAQVMKYHAWPSQGIGGTKSYTWETGNRTLSLNFSSQTFDWSSMLNTYTGSSTSTQKSAVAKLMYACGIASEMQYDIAANGGSGTNYGAAGTGMIQYLNYDSQMQFLFRSWYTYSDWCDLIYAELADKRPVLYAGQSREGGHAFVCDGYQSGDYFHINWGWGGYCDGYFQIATLDPGAEQGIGGSNSAFKDGQNILINIRKPQSSSTATVPRIAVFGNFATTKSSYNRTSSTNVGITATEGFYSLGLGTVYYDLGLRLRTSTDSQVLTMFENEDLDTYYGFSGFNVGATTFPTGEYDVSLVYRRTGTTEWQDCNYDVETCTNAVHFSVTSSKITVSAAQYTDQGGSQQENDPQFTAAINGYGRFNSSDTGFHPEHKYRFYYDCTIDGLYSGTWDKDIYLALVEDGYIIAKSDTQTLTFSGNTTTEYYWDLTFPYLVSEKSYSIVLVSEQDDKLVAMSSFNSLNVTYSATDGYGKVDKVEFTGFAQDPPANNSPSNPAVIDDELGGFIINMSCPLGPWSDDQICGAIATTSGSIISLTPTQSVSMRTNGTAEVTITVGSAPDKSMSRAPSLAAELGLDLSTTYMFVPWSLNHGQMYDTPMFFQLKDVIPSGVESVSADQEGRVEYYNLLGAKIDNPASGQILIRRQGSTAAKVVIR